MSGHALEHDGSRSGRWLRERRTRFVLWIAVIEAIAVALFHDVSRWTVIALAIVAWLVWLYAGRRSSSDTVRQATWIFAASQLLAIVAVVLAFIVVWTAILAAVAFAFIALFMVFNDRR